MPVHEAFYLRPELERKAVLLLHLSRKYSIVYEYKTLRAMIMTSRQQSNQWRQFCILMRTGTTLLEIRHQFTTYCEGVTGFTRRQNVESVKGSLYESANFKRQRCQNQQVTKLLLYNWKKEMLRVFFNLRERQIHEKWISISFVCLFVCFSCNTWHSKLHTKCKHL